MDAFEQNIEKAFEQIKRKELKAKLKKIQAGLEEEEETEEIKPLGTVAEKKWFPYKWVAAAMILIVGAFALFTYRAQKNIAPGKEVATQNKAKEPIIPNPSQPVPQKSKAETKIYSHQIYAEAIGQMGFATNVYHVIETIDKNNSETTYRFRKNNIEIKSSNRFKYKIYSLNKKLYLKFNDNVYLLEEHKSFEPLSKIINKEILDLIP